MCKYIYIWKFKKKLWALRLDQRNIAECPTSHTSSPVCKVLLPIQMKSSEFVSQCLRVYIPSMGEYVSDWKMKHNFRITNSSLVRLRDLRYFLAIPTEWRRFATTKEIRQRFLVGVGASSISELSSVANQPLSGGVYSNKCRRMSIKTWLYDVVCTIATRAGHCSSGQVPTSPPSWSSSPWWCWQVLPRESKNPMGQVLGFAGVLGSGPAIPLWEVVARQGLYPSTQAFVPRPSRCVCKIPRV